MRNSTEDGQAGKETDTFSVNMALTRSTPRFLHKHHVYWIPTRPEGVQTGRKPEDPLRSGENSPISSYLTAVPRLAFSSETQTEISL